MRSVVIDIFGAYTPLEGSGIASIDFEWIAGVIIFCIVLYGVIGLVFKLFGGKR